MNESTTETDPLIELLSATARGDQATFARLYAETSPQLFALLQRMLRRRDWAEEALQDCYLRIWKRSETYHPERGSPMAWMMTIARYRALDLLRMRRPEVNESSMDQPRAGLVDGEDPGQRPDQHAAEQESMGRLEHCLDSLDDPQRRALLLAYYEGYTHSELSERLETPMGTVKSWLRRGLQRLRDCLGVG